MQLSSIFQDVIGSETSRLLCCVLATAFVCTRTVAAYVAVVSVPARFYRTEGLVLLLCASVLLV